MKIIDQYSYSSYDTIGKGYSSQVYKGKNNHSSQPVAVKLIDMKFIKGEVHKKLLQNQIAVLKTLKKQENIIQLYDVYNTKTNTCIITQLCDEDLSKTIKDKKFLSQTEALSILKQIINGYRSIYFNDIVHRDLKPANIFFANGKIKIADFGFAIKSQQLKKRESYNVGSPVYMPYEALNDNMYSFKSDIWAIGVIFYEMLTGRTPWRAKTENDLKRCLKSSPIKTLLPSKISKISEQFLIKSLQFSPENRMSAEEIGSFFQKNRDSLEMSIQQKRMFGLTSKFTSSRPKAVSQQSTQPQENKEQILLNNKISGPKTYKKINILKGVGEDTTYDAKFLKTRATIKDKSDGSFQLDPKAISNQLVSQLHLCRFLFKLIERMSKIQFIDQTQTLKNQMTHIIFKKLEGIRNLTILDNDIAVEFRSYSEFNKLNKICEQYTQKYSKVLRNDINLYTQSTKIDQTIQNQIRSLYSYIIEYSMNPEQVRDEVILLDYLITLKQLLSLDVKVSIQEFQKRSKIEEIVEGKPTSNITKEHITAINTKIKAMKII